MDPKDSPSQPFPLPKSILLNKLRSYLEEDVGFGDITTSIIPATENGQAKIFAKSNGILAGLEFLSFGMLAFYKGAYTLGRVTYYSVRSVGPFHPIFQHLKELPTELDDDMMYRFATTRPYYDNFAQLMHKLALMGYEMHPLERYFKSAIQVAYGVKMDYLIYEVETWPSPKCRWFLNNFSVTIFTLSSVVCADRMVAIKSSSGFV